MSFFSTPLEKDPQRESTQPFKSPYEGKYHALVDQFFEFQQIEQTPEEEEYDKVCSELEQTIARQREEIYQLLDSNEAMVSFIEQSPTILSELNQLRQEEKRLLRIKSMIQPNQDF